MWVCWVYAVMSSTHTAQLGLVNHLASNRQHAQPTSIVVNASELPHLTAMSLLDVLRRLVHMQARASQ